MKSSFRKLAYVLVIIICKVITLMYKVKNVNKPKVLVYTDSRGFEISKWYNRKNPFSSYAGYFIKNFNCDVFICKHKHTTILDFLIDTKPEQYDAVIMHCGIVDFSTRPLSNVQWIYDYKVDALSRFFSASDLNNNLNNTHDTLYEGERTLSMYSLEQAIAVILPKLKSLDNLIWINSNKILSDWSGSYWKERPANINLVQEFNAIFTSELENTIDLSDWDEADIKRYTSDNIHFNHIGFSYILNELKSQDLIVNLTD